METGKLQGFLILFITASKKSFYPYKKAAFLDGLWIINKNNILDRAFLGCMTSYFPAI